MAKHTKVEKVGIERDPDYLYFINKEGHVARKKKGSNGRASVVEKTGIKKKKGQLYFLDKKGDISSVAMKRK
jgi:hypothetical protein